MNDREQRYSRQVRLAEVGAHGQARLARSALVVRRANQAGATAAQIELSYLKRAGVGHTVLEAAPPLPFVHADYFHHERSRQVAAGAWRALTQIKQVLCAPTSDSTE